MEGKLPRESDGLAELLPVSFLDSSGMRIRVHPLMPQATEPCLRTYQIVKRPQESFHPSGDKDIHKLLLRIIY